ncbi:hypothetical protein D3C71_2014200 [compost metagenome]
MSELFRSNTGNEIIEGLQLFFAAEVKRLEQIVIQGRHFSKFPAHQLLHGSGSIRVRTLYLRNFDSNFVKSFEHYSTSL